jgi:hypothetical protein|tara:strand:+ start:13363 stop:13938 length:576 start_codon:yes stop_codon:yes gene_type:complete
LISFFKKKFIDQLWHNLEILLEIEKKYSNFNILPDSGVLISDHDDNNNQFLSKIEMNINEILNFGDGSTGTSSKLLKDTEGMNWIHMKDPNSHDLLSSSYTVINAMYNNNSIDNIIGFVLKFNINHEELNDDIYLVYRMDIKSFYPFLPTSEIVGQKNQIKEDVFFKFLLQNKINLEKNKRKWLGIWGIPF